MPKQNNARNIYLYENKQTILGRNDIVLYDIESQIVNTEHSTALKTGIFFKHKVHIKRHFTIQIQRYQDFSAIVNTNTAECFGPCGVAISGMRFVYRINFEEG